MSRRDLQTSPCRDEAACLQVTIDAVAVQGVLPAKWSIVDDGSTEATPQILADPLSVQPAQRSLDE